MKKRHLLGCLLAGAVLWCFGTTLVLSQQPFFFPIPIAPGVSVGPTPICDTGIVGFTDTGGATSVSTLTLTTTHSNDILIVLFSSAKVTSGTIVTVPPHNIIDSNGLVWAQRTSSSGSQRDAELWWAYSPTVYSGTITANFSPAIAAGPVFHDSALMLVEAITGVGNPSSPWDTNGALPAITTGASSVPSGSYTTTTPNDALLWLLSSGTTAAGTANPTAFTNCVNYFNGAGVFVGGNISTLGVSAAQSGATYTSAGPSLQSWLLIADAIPGP